VTQDTGSGDLDAELVLPAEFGRDRLAAVPAAEPELELEAEPW
jgi:hypothetical protein